MSDRSKPQPSHETRDVNVRGVAASAAGLVVATALIYFVVAGLFQHLKQTHPSPDAPSRIALHPRMLAPAPQLQTNVTADLATFQASENARLRSYGWVDRSAGIIHIPIERAMELIAERGLPTRGSGTQNASGITPVQMQERKAAATKP